MKESFLSRKDQIRDILLALLAIILIGSLGFWFYFQHRDRLQEAALHELELESEIMARQMESQIERALNSLKNLRYRLELTQGRYMSYWEYDAALLRQQNPSFSFIEWIDSNGIIRKIQPLAGNEEALMLDISKLPGRYREWRHAMEDSTLNYTGWIKLNQSGHAFLVDAPVFYDGLFHGTISAGLNFRRQFDHMLENTQYRIKLYDQQGRLFYEHGGDFQTPWTLQRNIDFAAEEGLQWKLEVSPNGSLISRNGQNENTLRLFLVMLLGCSVGFLIYYSRQLRRHSRKLNELNVDLKRLNRQYESEKEKALAASRIKTEFLSNMSHEIRTPLNAILGLINIMQQQNLRQEHQQYLQMMSASSQNLLSIINNILEIDKIESGKTQLAQEAFTPAREVRRLLDIHRPNFQEKKLQLDGDFDNSFHRVKGDKIKLIQIINNLLRNAYKFTPSGKVVLNFRETVSGSRVKISIRVADTGIGIPEEKRDQVFERFSQVDSSYQKKYEGSGLGLAISKKLVEMMGGSIYFRDRPGGGTEFIMEITLPLESDETDAALQDASARPEFKGMRVLIAEDNPMNVLVLSKVLQQMKVQCEVAENGVEVLEKVEKQSFDLIFMDIHMPEMDGFEATVQLRRREIKIPVVALSANILRETMDRAKALGIKEYLTKPFRREELVEVLRKYYNKRI